MTKRKMKRSKQIAEQIATANGRIADLKIRRDEHAEKLQAANVAFMKNDNASFDDVLPLKHSLGLIAETIESLEAMVERLNGELEAAKTVESQAEALGEMSAIIGKRKTHFAGLVATRQALNDAAAEMLMERNLFNESRDAFLSKMCVLVPGFNLDSRRWPHVAPEFKTQVAAVIAELEREGVERADIDLILGEPELPTIEHEAVAQSAENWQAQQARQAAEWARLRRKDEAAARQQAAKDEAAKRFEEESRVRAVKQTRKWNTV